MFLVQGFIATDHLLESLEITGETTSQLTECPHFLCDNLDYFQGNCFGLSVGYLPEAT